MSNSRSAPYSSRQMVLFIIVCLAIIFGYTQLEKWLWPPQKTITPQQQLELKSNLPIVIGSAPMGDGFDAFRMIAQEMTRQKYPDAKKHAEELAKAAPPKEKPKPIKRPQMPPELIALGDASYNLQVRLTNHGAGVDQIIVTHFPAADKDGKAEIDPQTNKPKPLLLIPGTAELTEEERAERSAEDLLPAFLLYHYERPSDDRPSADLGERSWDIVSRPVQDSEVQSVVFETVLGEPYNLKIIKSFSLRRGQYHVDLSVKFERLADKNTQPLRYQLSGGRRLPIEGEWYTSAYRNAVFGWDQAGNAERHLEDSRTIHHNHGSEKIVRVQGRTFQYAATAIQYFASAICVDDQQKKRDFIEAVRATREGSHVKDLPMLGDICPRVVSEPIEVKDEVPEHKFLLYHGPVKVRLLAQLRGNKAVPIELVDRYEHTLNLRTMTDYRSDTWIGKFANFIFWTDLVILATNGMHWVLGMLNLYLPGWLAILVLTVIVRGALLPLSRRQTAAQMKITEKMQKLNPELKKLEEQYKGRDPQELHQAKMKLMMEHGINPLSSLGGCFLMLLQMPIFMGLYFCLQENVFFRLEGFLWIDNLSAPDMLFRWGDWMKVLGANIGDTLYLGPYFNLLPAITVTLYIIQQKFLMPPPVDEQQKFQQSMMKYMMVVVGVMFFKVAAGLCLYFIASSLWGLAERKLFPKPKVKPEEEGLRGKGKKKGEVRSKGRFARWLEKVLEEAQKKNR